MKKNIFSVILTLFISSYYCQTVVSSCVASDSVVNSYRDDIDRLCLRRSFHVNSTWKDSVFIDTTLRSRYLKALLAVYNATMLPARDTVINKCKIHVSPNPDTKTIFIAGDSNLVWLKNIRYNVSPCGKPVIDNAIIKYGLQKTSFSAPSWWNIHSVTYKKTNGNLNMYKLGLIFSAIPSSSGPNTTTIDGTDIEDSLNVNFTMLEYSYGWGDCWNGCMFRRYWQFKVFNDCSVEYIKSYGNAVPPNVAIKENEQLFSDVKVYPNPFNAKIRIDNLGSSSDRLSVFNTLGQTVFEVKGMVDKEIDLSYLSSGIFYLKLEKGFASRTFMIIKE